tara:strand:- start:33381 stop:33941 length:561 start_codon:yes stop_codon:yes gene_type:complete
MTTYIKTISLEDYLAEFEDSAKEAIANFSHVLENQATELIHTQSYIDEYSSEAKLKEIMAAGDLYHARSIEGNDQRIIYGMNAERPDLGKVKIEGYKRTGVFGYPQYSFCGWHTNNNNEGERTYIVYNEEENQGFFKYYDADKDEIITKWEPKGVTTNIIDISASKPCWHFAGSLGNRISVGFRKI